MSEQKHDPEHVKKLYEAFEKSAEILIGARRAYEIAFDKVPEQDREELNKAIEAVEDLFDVKNGISDLGKALKEATAEHDRCDKAIEDLGAHEPPEYDEEDEDEDEPVAEAAA